MKKIIFSFFATFFVLIFIWYVMGFIRYGDKLMDMHLDLKSSLQNITNVVEFNVSDYLDALESWTEITRFEGSFADGVVLFFDCLFIEPFKVLSKFVNLFIFAIIGIVKFVFFPVFI